jgi:hypothetical protein
MGPLRNAAALATALRSRTPAAASTPSDVQREAGRGQVQDGPAAADLDVVGVRADGQDLDRAASLWPQREWARLGRAHVHWNLPRRSFRLRSSSHAHRYGTIS